MHQLLGPQPATRAIIGTAPRDDQPSATPPFVYEGPFAKTVTNLKRLSIASCAATTLLSPLLVALAYDDGSTVATKAAVAATVCSFGLFTTGMLHWFTSPYVLRLVHVPGSDQVELETKTILGGTVKTTVHMPGDIKPANTMQPLSTFEVQCSFTCLHSCTNGHLFPGQGARLLPGCGQLCQQGALAPPHARGAQQHRDAQMMKHCYGYMQAGLCN